MKMKRVVGLGGVFFKCKDPDRTTAWYSRHLGIESESHGSIFQWRDFEDPKREGYTIWSPFPNRTRYFDPARKAFMLNYRVANLVSLVAMLRKEHVEIIGDIMTYDYGKFAWIMDPEGNKIELFEPPGAGPVKKRQTSKKKRAK